jgi:tetratricopeptide (TPR) repeat protein
VTDPTGPATGDAQAAEDPLVGLLGAGERAAFHAAPATGVPPLTRAVELARGRGQSTEAAAAGWLLGVCLAAAGRYGEALEVLEGVAAADAHDAAERHVVAALAGATQASVHRQLGRHAAARAYDQQALARTDGTGEAGFDAVLGLAADAVGLGDTAAAAAELARAEALTRDRPEWWRQRVRLGWVAAEHALATGLPDLALTAATSALELAERSGAPRHVAKSLLFVGVGQIETGRPDQAATTLRRAALLAESLGALPLVWPARAVLGTLLAGSRPAVSTRCLAAARAAVADIAAGLPPQLRAEWLARPDVAPLVRS